jgi:hypothetical protein
VPETTCPGLQENVLTCLVELYVGLRWTRNVGRPGASSHGTVVTSKFARIPRTGCVPPAKNASAPVCRTYGALHIQVHMSDRDGPLAGLTFVTRREFYDILAMSRKLPGTNRHGEIEKFFRLPEPKDGDTRGDSQTSIICVKRTSWRCVVSCAARPRSCRRDLADFARALENPYF